MKNIKKTDDKFTLHDLKVEVIGSRGKMVCKHKIGDYFKVSGENIIFQKGRKFSMYALSAILPLLPAKQRMTDVNDWMTTDTDIACPDRNCGGIFRITRVEKRIFRHSKTTVVPLMKEGRKNDRKV